MKYYRKLQSAHSNQTLTMLDGAQRQRYGRLERGVIQGDCRNMQIIIADEKGFDGLGFDATIGSQDDSYAVVNLFDSVNRYIDSVAIAGADDADHAIHLALSQFDYLEPAYATLVANEGDGSFEPSFDSLCWESDTIAKLMNNRSQDRGHYLPIITKKMLDTEKNRVTHNDVLWDGVNLVSHSGDYSRLLVDIQKNDSHHELTAQFDMAGFLANLDVTELGLDALMDTNNRLDLMKERLFRALAKQSIDGLSVTDAVLTKPFKKAGVANVAMQFNLSDGQTFTILFHNPDADPKKLGAQDTMVSWKWMLNKRDITAAVSPKNGENVQLAPLATRMMKVAKANSKRFAAAQSKKSQNQQALTDAQKEVDDKKAKLDTINAHIAELQTELEKIGQAKTEPTTDPTPETKKGKWYENQPDNVSVYLIGKSRINDSLKITENTVNTNYSAFISIAGVGGEFIGDLAGLKKWVNTRTQKMGGGAYELNHVAGKDVLEDTTNTSPVAAGESFTYNGKIYTMPSDSYKNSDIYNTMLEMFRANPDDAVKASEKAISEGALAIAIIQNSQSPDINMLQYLKIRQQQRIDSLADLKPQFAAEPTPEPQPTAPTSELSPEERKLNKLIKERDMMKDINKITRMKISDDEKIAKIMEFGIKQDTAHTLATGEGTWDKRQGFAPYELTSVNNRIKTLQAKVDAMKKADEINNSLGGEDMVLAGVSIILNKEADRIQLDFPSKPSRDVIAVLKKNGWKWSPSNQVWQRQLTENAMRNARTMVEAYADDEGIDMEDESNTAPTQAAPQTPPATKGGDEGDTNSDADYLQTVIDGSIGLSTENMKQVITEIKRIAKAGTVDKDLLNQAIEAYQTFALSVKVA